MKNRPFLILMTLLVLGLGLGCRKPSNDLADPEDCNNPFTAIPCTTLEGVGQFGSSSMSGDDGSTPVQTRLQILQIQ